MPFAARITDAVLHPLPPVLTGGPTAVTVIIGFLPAWRGIGAALAGSLSGGKIESEKNIKKAELATVAAKTAGNPAAITAAEANEKKVKFEEQAKMATAILSAAAMTDIHNCAVFIPPPVHGPGVDIKPSKTVFIKGQPAARQGDEILEPIGPPNFIVMGCPTVLIGG
jgi:uncharacterized Zn-binding protein involved in type VI secretion